MAGSDGGSIRFEEFGEYFAGFLPTMDLTGTVVDLGGDGGEVVQIAGDLHALFPSRPWGSTGVSDERLLSVSSSGGQRGTGVPLHGAVDDVSEAAF